MEPDLGFMEALLIAIGIAWAGWVSVTLILMLVKNSNSQRDVKALFSRFDEFCLDLKNDFSVMKSEVTADIDEVNKRFDQFLKSEIDTLKEIAKQKRGG